MKIITEPQTDNTIVLNKLDPSQHTIVGKVRGDLVIAKAREYQSLYYELLCLTHGFTYGNSYNPSNLDLPQLIKKYPEGEFHAFTDYKDALKWLVEQTSDR